MKLTTLKRTALTVLTVPGAATLFRGFMRDRATVFMLHRISDGGTYRQGHPVEEVRATLEWLRRNQYPLISLRDLLSDLEEGHVPSRAVVFTIDDGYAEQALLAGPLFAEFDCPVTTFLTTGFVDGRLWMWWDRANYAFLRTTRREVSIEAGDQKIAYAWNDEAERRSVQREFIVRCKRMPNVVKQAAIDALAIALDVELPQHPPEGYAPMTWDEARAAERAGMTFGPHTSTHPILSKTTDDCLDQEIGDSWRRVQQELANPVPIFCYPNGEQRDYGQREISVIQRLGLRGAVLSTPGYASPRSFHRSATAPFEVPRFSYPSQLPLVIQVVSGMERVKGLWRGEDA
jgi:peptidoglycan/xylan/chitin deacetylase (PgdA/CDA1 family)